MNKARRRKAKRARRVRDALAARPAALAHLRGLARHPEVLGRTRDYLASFARHWQQSRRPGPAHE